MRICPAKKRTTFSAQFFLDDPPSNRRALGIELFGGADRFAAIELPPQATDANKDQQVRARKMGFEATKINRNQHNSTESAKVSKINPDPRAQSAKISNSQ
jgi:hypothetical protein